MSVRHCHVPVGLYGMICVKCEVQNFHFFLERKNDDEVDLGISKLQEMSW